MGDNRTHRGMIAKRSAEAAAQHPVRGGFVVVIFVRTRPDQADAIHDLGDFGKQFADVQAGDGGGDAFVFAADLLHGIRLQIKSIVMGNTPAKVNQDHRFRPCRRGSGDGPGLIRGEQGRQRKP